MINLPKIKLEDPAVQLTLAAGAGLLLYFLLKKKAGDTLSNAVIESQQVAKVQVPTYTPTQYQVYADKIYSAGVTWFGTDETAIYNAFNAMYNDLDILKLIEAFGRRRLEFSTVMGNLTQFLYDELNNTELGKLNSILAMKGIKYQF